MNMMKQKLFIVTILLFAATASPLFAQVNCYSRTRQRGIELMNQTHYAEAITLFQSAMSCPDKPESNDLQAKIRECRRLQDEMEEEERINNEKRRAADARLAAERRRKLEAEMEAKGYMDVSRLRVANTLDGEILSSPGEPLYESDVRFIQPILSYRGLAREYKDVDLFVKFIKPDGSLIDAAGSPAGYSYKESVRIAPHGGQINFKGWGNRDGGIFTAGTYTCEIWYNGQCLFSNDFSVLPSNYSKKDGVFQIKDMFFANTTIDNKVISGYGSPLYSDDIRFLKAKIRYNSDQNQRFDLAVKIYQPDGTIITDPSAPDGYSMQDSYTVHTGSGQELVFLGLGARNKSTYPPGAYRYEVWLDGTRLFAKSFNVLEAGWRKAVKKVMDHATDTFSSDKYKGVLAANKQRDGLGVYLWSDGSSYWGEWSEGHFEGNGIYIASPSEELSNCPGCAFYVGSFVDNARSGQGRCYNLNGDLIYSGSFSGGVPTDPYPSGENPSRRFEIQSINGDYYIGETLDGQRHGTGIYIWASGDAWFGSWENDSRKADGLYLWYDGTVE